MDPLAVVRASIYRNPHGSDSEIILATTFGTDNTLNLLLIDISLTQFLRSFGPQHSERSDAIGSDRILFFNVTNSIVSSY